MAIDRKDLTDEDFRDIDNEYRRRLDSMVRHVAAEYCVTYDQQKNEGFVKYVGADSFVDRCVELLTAVDIYAETMDPPDYLIQQYIEYRKDTIKYEKEREEEKKQEAREKEEKKKSSPPE